MDRQKKITGFTLIELMVALAVVGVILLIGIPSYAALITTNRMSSEMNDIVSSLQYARSEAVKRGLTVSVCRSSAPPNCNAPAGGWEQGWIVVVNDGPGGVPQTVLKNIGAFESTDSFTGAGNTADAIVFDRNGFALNSNGILKLCDVDNTARNNRALSIGVTGRVNLAEDSDHDGTVDFDGVNVTCP